jgi:hypothetical protein
MLPSNIIALIAGAYELQEWHAGGSVLRPPHVQGRFILVSGTVTTILYNRTSSERQMTSVLVGKYAFGEAHFSYGYHDASIFIETPSGLSVSHTPPWEGTRSFAAIVTAAGVQLRSEGGEHVFTFTQAGFAYSENGQPLRIWRRLGSV